MTSSRVLLLAIFALALLIRGGVAFSNLNRFDADPDAYRMIGETLAITGVYGVSDGSGSAKPTAFRPPLYPYVLSWLVKDGQLACFPIAVLHAFLGAITVLLTFVVAQRCIPGLHINRVAGIATLFVAIDPILLQQSTLVMTETLATALVSIIVGWWVVYCRSAPTARTAMVLGLLMSLAFLCRPTFLVWAGLLGIVLLVAGDSSWQSRIARTAAYGLVVAATVLGWTMRNQRELGHPVWATTHGGYTLLLANNPSLYDYLRTGSFGQPWDAEAFFVAHSHRYDGDPNTEAFWYRDWATPATSIPIESEVADDRRCHEAARATIDRHPQMFIWSCLVRCGSLWSPLPQRLAERSLAAVYAVGAYYVLFMTLMLVGLWRLKNRAGIMAWWPAITLVIALSAVHAVYWSNMRMRAPAIPAMAIVAAAAFWTRQVEATAADSGG